MGKISQPKKPAQGQSFDDAWARRIEAMAAEADREFKEIRLLMKETDRRMKETDRRMKETDEQMKETDRRMKETDRRIGELGSRLGEVIEHIMSPKLHEKFKIRGFHFNHSSRNHEIEDAGKNILAEIDVLLENGAYVMAVEVKTRLTSKDVRDHVKRMEILRHVADGHNDTRKYLGAVAGAVIGKEVIAYALKTGFFVIDPSGEAVVIIAPEGFEPRIW